MNVNMPSAATTTQTIKILTDVEIASSIFCPITAILTPAAAFISLSPDFKTIFVDASKIVDPSDIKTHLFRLTVNSANFAGTVAQQTYDFKVIMTSCSVTSYFQTNHSRLKEIFVDVASFNITHYPASNFTDTLLAGTSTMCPITATLSPSVPYLRLSADFKQITVYSEWLGLLDVGAHDFVIQVTNTKNNTIQQANNFKLVFNFGDPCPYTEIIMPLIKPMNFTLGSKDPTIQKF